jgi:hypothetical protein
MLVSTAEGEKLIEPNQGLLLAQGDVATDEEEDEDQTQGALILGGTAAAVTAGVFVAAGTGGDGRDEVEGEVSPFTP